MAATAFYESDGERFAASELTRGPWDPDAQHAGPPAALLGRAIEGLPSDEPKAVGRITFEILRPVPIAPLRTEARLVRPGRNVELVEASLYDESGPVVSARAWRLRIEEVELGPLPRPQAPAGPEHGAERGFFPTGERVGYHTAMEYRFVAGEFISPGPATVWMRMRHPLVAGEAPSPLQRVLVAADSGNGVSAALDWRRFLFINVDLTVHLHRMPATEWVRLDAVTVPQPSGIGLADTALHDERGPIGRATQTLLVRRRDG